MYIKWDDSLSVGIELIDSQHKELFERINHLLRAIGELHAQDELVKTLDFMQEYALLHFGEEEEQMQLADYPGFDAHKRQHDHMRGEIEKMRGRLTAEGSNERLLVDAQELLVDWLEKHIRNVDMAMGRYFIGLK